MRSGGVLRHARALSALLNPTINSYKRFGPDTLAPWLIDWGLDNRSAMVRIPPERGAAARMEVRLGDATANPYLAMAAVGAAVCLGIADKVEPPEKLEGYGYDPAAAELLPHAPWRRAGRAGGRPGTHRGARRLLRRRRSWRTSATRSSASSVSSPTGNSASTPTTSDSRLWHCRCRLPPRGPGAAVLGRRP